MLITDMENLSQFYQLRHLTEPCMVKYMACSLQTQQALLVIVGILLHVGVLFEVGVLVVLGVLRALGVLK